VVPLSSAEFRLLVAFLTHPRQVLDRDRLLDMVQGREAHLFDRAVDNQVSRLRRKMEVRQPRSEADPDRVGRRLPPRRRRPPRRARSQLSAPMRRFLPRSLLGQMLLSVALALLVAQTISAVLQYRSAEQRREMIAANGLAFQLVTEPRFDFRRPNAGNRARTTGGAGSGCRSSGHRRQPVHAGETRDPAREEMLRSILPTRGRSCRSWSWSHAPVVDDAYVMDQLRHARTSDWARGGCSSPACSARASRMDVARFPDGRPRAEPARIPDRPDAAAVRRSLVGGLAWLLRRITRPIAALTKRLERFAATRELDGQLEPSGPDDTRRLIAAHNAMEARISALLYEKDVMLGAIGHDLKTPLAALRRAHRVGRGRRRARQDGGEHRGHYPLARRHTLACPSRPPERSARTHRPRRATRGGGRGVRDMEQPVELAETGTPRHAAARDLAQARAAQPDRKTRCAMASAPGCRWRARADRRWCGSRTTGRDSPKARSRP
jgi:hypothetical protein